MTTAVDRLYLESVALKAHLDGIGEISLSSSADANYRKALLLAAASYFEVRLCSHITEYVEGVCGSARPVPEFVKNKAVKRQYHTYFDWDRNNANPFFGLFGAEFRDRMAAEVEADDDLRDSISAFLEVGRERNRLVHQDFASFALEKTAEEIFKLYQRALPFVEAMPGHLLAASSDPVATDDDSATMNSGSPGDSEPPAPETAQGS